MRSVDRDIADLRERDPGFRCAYCCALLAMPAPRGTIEEEWDHAGWELYLLPDGEAVWQVTDGRLTAHREHVHPRSKGGSDDLDNLVLACEPCNRDKKATPLVLWFARRSGCPRYRSVGGDHREALARAWGAG